ncbi:MAG: DUF1624 domain-containing protein [Oscillospiraceae bacterium]|jgi:predicted acyltransferase|nr:DUF1624 domain-containing protein [Oscillospiraceae bacterium]
MASPNRNLAIDRYRGLAVLAMVIVNDLANTQGLPAFLKHAPDIGYTLADAVAPMFIFAIGLTYGMSFRRKKESSGTYAACLSTARRYLAILGLGALFSAGGAAVGEGTAWGVLQSIGVAGLLTLVIISLRPWLRLAVGLLLLGGYQYLLDWKLLDSVLGASHGGIFGSIAWGAMLILCTSLADSFGESRPLLLWGGCITAAMIAAVRFAAISKNRVSASYVLISILLCALLYLFVNELSKRAPRRGLLSMCGENALLLYVGSLLLMGIERTLTGWDDVGLLLGAVRCALLTAAILAIAWALGRKQIRVAL